jgi:tetratricopeptide (TPR) repeat protein
MFDLGIFTIPIIGALSVFTVALFLGEDVVIEKIEVTHQMEWNGYNSDVATRQLTDELRKLSAGAASELTGLEVDESIMERGVEAFEDYFEISVLINGTRNIFGMIPYYVAGEMTEKRGEALFTARVYTLEEEHPVYVVTASGSMDDPRIVMRDAAIDILERINPYIIALYHRKEETAAEQFDYPKTHAAVERYLADRPLDEHYLAYGLLGRLHMIKAERDTALTPEQREAEYQTAEKFLHAALIQRPDFLYPMINLGLIHAERGDLTLAEQYYARAVEKNPNYLLTRTAWGDLLIKQGRRHEAIYQYVAAVELDRENADLRDKLAELYQSVGQHEAAREQWRMALEIAPTTPQHAAILRAIATGEKVPVDEKDACGHGMAGMEDKEGKEGKEGAKAMEGTGAPEPC